MQNEKKYLFVLNDTTFKISFSSCLLLIKKSIYNKLITTQLYKVKSNVSNTVFDSFLKYLTDKETPNINSYNFYEYEELSNEFDIMQPLIQLYQNKIKLTTNIALLLKNQKLNIKLDSISFNFSQKQKNYEKIIQILFKENQLNTCFKFSPNHHQIYQSCVDSNLKKLENLTKNEIIQNGLSFILDEKEKTSSLYHNIKAVGNIIIPSFIKYKRKKYFVNRIHENAFNKSNGVKSIQFSADCKDILIEKSSLSCESLKKVVLPSNLNHFNAEYFCESENLSEISIDSKNSNFLFYENKFLIGKEEQNNEQYDVLLFASRNLEEVQIPSFIKRIGPYAFESCRKLKRVFFQNDSQLKKIDRFAFFKSNLESISIPSSVKRICEGSFSLCYKLKQFEIKNDSQLKSIGIEAFCESSLESVSIPANIVRISNGAFKKCVNFKKVEFHENSKLKSIGQSAFSNTSIECISIPSHLIQIESNAFAFCYDLSRIDFSNDSELQLIGKRVFYKTKIENIAIPSSVLDIQAGFAMGNSATINIDPNNNRFLLYQQKFLLSKTDLKNDIYDIILLASSEIKTVKIFPFINKIASYAFANCKNLQNVDFSQNKNLCSIEKYSFNNTSLKNITIPSKIVKIGKNSFSLCASLKKVDFESHSNLVSFENYAFAWSSLIEISFPSSLKKINKYAFYSCYNLKKVQFDNDSKLEKIGKCAFASSGLERMLIPANVIEIGQEAFYGCKFLENLIFYENSRLKIINNRAFSDSTIRCISISQSVTEIWDFVFFNCQKLEIIEFLNIKSLKYFNINYLCMHPNNKNMIIMITN